MGLSIIQHYGMLQERLKTVDPEFYWMLYNKRPETSYIFVEPILKPYLGYAGINNEKEVRNIIQNILRDL